MGRPQKPRKNKGKAKVKFKTKVYVGNESRRKEQMLKETERQRDSLQVENAKLQKQLDSLKVIIKIQ